MCFCYGNIIVCIEMFFKNKVNNQAEKRGSEGIRRRAESDSRPQGTVLPEKERDF